MFSNGMPFILGDQVSITPMMSISISDNIDTNTLYFFRWDLVSVTHILCRLKLMNLLSH